MSNPTRPAVIVITSLVARGGVGLRAAAFALERLGFPVWQVPTVFLPWHTGHGRSTRIVPPAEQFAAALGELAASRHLGEVGAIISGYLGEASQAGPIAALVAALKARRPDALYVCDPVAGDEGGLYVPDDTAAALRDVLLPIADVATPNRFELSWATGQVLDTPAAALAAARQLAPPTVLVTSAPALMRGSTALMLCTPQETLVAEHPLFPEAPSGTGDLASALLTAQLISGVPPEAALRRVAATLFELVARSSKAGSDELVIAAEQDSLVRPMAHVAMRRMATVRRV